MPVLILELFCHLNDAINIPASDVASNSQFAWLELPLLCDAQRRGVHTLERWNEIFYCHQGFPAVLICPEQFEVYTPGEMEGSIAFKEF